MALKVTNKNRKKVEQPEMAEAIYQNYDNVSKYTFLGALAFIVLMVLLV